jgi:hypothetical protein
MSRVTREGGRVLAFGALALLGFDLSACGGGGGSHGPPAKPTVAFSVTPSTVDYAGSATLSWSSTNATGCMGLWASGPLAPSGSMVLTGLIGTGSFSITCTGPGGTASASAPITVKPLPLPAVSLTATSAIVPLAGMDTLRWTTTGATSCFATGGWTGTQSVSGSSPIGPITTQTLYTLTCDGAGGAASSSVTVGISSTLPPAGPIAKLAAAVLVVKGTPLQQGPNFVTFSGGGPTPFVPGTIFVLGGVAYKVSSTLFTQGDPALFPPDFIPMPVVEVSTVPPALDEVFDQIDISGVYTLDASQMVAQSTAAQTHSAQRMRLSLKARPDAAALITVPLNLNQPPLQITGSGTVTLQATADVHYSKAAGFTNSSVAYNTSAQANLRVATTAALAQPAAGEAVHFSIPIPLTVIDSQSNLVAVSAASIDVPVAVVAQPTAGYALSYAATLQGSASTTVAIAGNGALSETAGAGAGTNSLTISNSTAAPDPSTPALATLGASLYAGVDLSPSLQLMSSVTLVTADGKIGDRYNGELEILTSGSSPTYCGGDVGALELQASASLTLSSNMFTAPTQPPLSVALSTLGPQPIVSYCGTQPIVTGSTSAAAALFSPLAVAVNVVAPPNGSSPAPAPTGLVQATLDGAHCTATIDSAGNGSCNLTPTTSGARTLALQYLGDSNYPAGAVISQPLDVALAKAEVTLTFTPNPISFASTITFNFTVTPSPQSIAPPTPTGSVTVMAFGLNPCASTIDGSGHGSCTFAMTSLPNFLTVGHPFTLMTATYSGDGNYLSAVAPAAPLPIIGLSVSYPAGTDSIPTGGTVVLVVNAANVISSVAVATPPNLTWTSSNAAVATVAAGTVTGVAAGTSTITVTDPVSLASASIVVTIVDAGT